MTQHSRAQSWSDCDVDIKRYVLELADLLKTQLGSNLAGIYLHGSLAMGSYYRPKSDLDLLVVVQHKLSSTLAKALGMAIAKKAESRPTTGNVELSVLTAKTAKEVPIPTPFELHYSSDWHEQLLHGQTDYGGKKTDIDLQTYILYVKQRGVLIHGKPISQTFGECSWQHFMDGVMDDFNWIVADKHILETPFYSVLNICRVLQLLSENDQKVHSKDEGGEWGLLHLPEAHHGVIKKALDVYRSGDAVSEAERRTGGMAWDEAELLALRDYARSYMKQMKSQLEMK